MKKKTAKTMTASVIVKVATTGMSGEQHDQFVEAHANAVDLVNEFLRAADGVLDGSATGFSMLLDAVVRADELRIKA